jgi:hypothetical protein
MIQSAYELLSKQATFWNGMTSLDSVLNRAVAAGLLQWSSDTVKELIDNPTLFNALKDLAQCSNYKRIIEDLKNILRMHYENNSLFRNYEAMRKDKRSQLKLFEFAAVVLVLYGSFYPEEFNCIDNCQCFMQCSRHFCICKFANDLKFVVDDPCFCAISNADNTEFLSTILYCNLAKPVVKLFATYGKMAFLVDFLTYMAFGIDEVNRAKTGGQIAVLNGASNARNCPKIVDVTSKGVKITTRWNIYHHFCEVNGRKSYVPKSQPSKTGNSLHVDTTCSPSIGSSALNALVTTPPSGPAARKRAFPSIDAADSPTAANGRAISAVFTSPAHVSQLKPSEPKRKKANRTAAAAEVIVIPTHPERNEGNFDLGLGGLEPEEREPVELWDREYELGAELEFPARTRAQSLGHDLNADIDEEMTAF